MRRTLTCILATACCLVFLPQGWGQSSDSSPGAQEKNKTEPAKARRVWTNEEIQKIRDKGGINVVGEATADDDKNPPAGEKPRAPADQPEACESDAWAAAVAAIVRRQGANLDANFWATKLFGGACISGVRLEAVAGRMSGDYAQADGTKIRLTSEPIPKGLPSPADMVAALDEGRPFLVVWKGRPLLATHVNYVDRVYSDGTRVYTISKLTLVDPGNGRTVLFDAVKTPLSEIDGSLQIKATSARR